MTTPTPEGWEKEFDAKFNLDDAVMYRNDGDMEDIDPEEVKSFISSLFLSERQKMAEEVEKLETATPFFVSKEEVLTIIKGQTTTKE